MTGTELSALISLKTKATTTTFSAADRLVLVNIRKDEIASRIQKRRQEIWNMPTLANLVGDQREYSFPSDVMNNIVSLELKFTASGDYVVAKPASLNHVKSVLQESKIVENYDNLEPEYVIRRKAIYILSGTIIAVTSGIKLVYNAFPANLANLSGSTDLSVDPSTTTHGFPREFHELLARRVGMDYKMQPGVNMKFNVEELNYENDLEKALEDFSIANLDEEIIGALPSGSTRGDNGYNY